MRIAVDPGHGASNKVRGQYDPGACAGGVQEADVVLAWALTLKWVLAREGIQVWLTRDDDTDAAPVGTRDDRAVAAHASHFISIHANASRNPLVSGVETFYRDGADHRLANIVHAAALGATGLRDRGIRHESQTAVKRLAVMGFPGPCCLVEIGYITCPRDRRVMLRREVRLGFAERLVPLLRGLR